MKKTIIYILIFALVMAGGCPVITGCSHRADAQAESTTLAQEETTQSNQASEETSTEPTSQNESSAQKPNDKPATQTQTQEQPQTQTQTQAQPQTQKTEGTTTGQTQTQHQQAEAPTQQPEQTPSEQPKTSRDFSAQLKTTLANLAEKVPEPTFGTLMGEWTVLCLARGNHFEKNDTYFSGYYSRIETIVAQKAATVNQNGALHRAKSTENSRLIVALSAIGKDATNVGGWNLITPYDNFNWILKQGINGPIWALIALDSADYQTQDPTIRQKCLDHILQEQLSDGGWALTGKVSDPDITAMTLQALYPYRDRAEIKQAAEKGFACLSALQKANGGYVTFGDENSESCAQVIVACATWGIDPDTDSRFVKNGVSVLDAFLAYYVKAESGFKHVQSGKVDAMATDQGTYALIAYQRLIDGKNPLYDMRDVAR